jgi:hypothetical protein
MRKEANLKQWKELYDITFKIKELKPWEHLWDMDLIVIHLKGREEPCFFSIMGRAGECLGINVYTDNGGLNDFYDIVESAHNEISAEYALLNQNSLCCFFDDRENVPKEQKKLIKDLGFKFRGRNQWIYFESYKSGYFPYIPDEEEVLLLTQCFRELLNAINYYLEEDINVDFENGEALIRKYSEEKKEWYCYADSILLYEREFPIFEIKDEVLLARLKKQKVIPAQLELDVFYTNIRLNEQDEFDRPINPKMVVIAEHNDGYIIGQHLNNPNDNDPVTMLNLLLSFIIEYGKPEKIYVTNPSLICAAEDLCDNLNIDLITDVHLSAIESFKIEFLEGLFR